MISVRLGVCHYYLSVILRMACYVTTLNTLTPYRPGAVCNATIDEFKNAHHTERGITVIKVHKHKTGKFGTAKLTMDAKLSSQLNEYVLWIRPLAVGGGEDPGTLFVLPGSKPILKWSNLESMLQEQFGTKIPTSTLARKIGTTCATRQINGDTGTMSLITSQMSHQAAVSRKHYACVAGTEDAATAFQALEKLRGVESSSSESVPPQTRYKVWTVEEGQKIKCLFKTFIEKNVAPPLHRCSSSIAEFPGRSGKNIVKTLRRQHIQEFVNL